MLRSVLFDMLSGYLELVLKKDPSPYVHRPCQLV